MRAKRPFQGLRRGCFCIGGSFTVPSHEFWADTMFCPVIDNDTHKPRIPSPPLRPLPESPEKVYRPTGHGPIGLGVLQGKTPLRRSVRPTGGLFRLGDYPASRNTSVPRLLPPAFTWEGVGHLSFQGNSIYSSVAPRIPFSHSKPRRTRSFTEGRRRRIGWTSDIYPRLLQIYPRISN